MIIINNDNNVWNDVYHEISKIMKLLDNTLIIFPLFL